MQTFDMTDAVDMLMLMDGVVNFDLSMVTVILCLKSVQSI